MNAHEAAQYLGIAVKTLYKWKRQARANSGYLVLGGVAVPFRFRQTGALGQGRLYFEQSWLNELKLGMEERPLDKPLRKREALNNITATLGLPPE